MPKQASPQHLDMMALAKLLMSLIFVGTAAWCWIHQIPLDPTLEKAILTIVGVYSLGSAFVYHEASKNGKKG